MKRFKINFALLAIVLASTAAFAFKAPAKHKIFNPLWQYDGSGSTTDPSNYFQVSSLSCPTGTNICAIMAPADPDDSDVPKIDAPLSGRISSKTTSSGDVFLRN